MDDAGIHLDIMGQGESLYRLYTQLCLCYSMSNDSELTRIADALNAGLERLTNSFPWVAGQVIPGRDGNPESDRITPYEKVPVVKVKDLRDENVPSWKAMRDAKVPFSMLDENAIAPINTLAMGIEGPAPVMLIQITLIPGGLLLTLATQHNVMDMTGMVQVMSLLSKACHDEPVTAEELRIGNMDRRGLIPLLDELYTPGPELDRQIQKSASQTDNSATESSGDPPECSWSYFLFSGPSLSELKALATKSLPKSSDFVSTDDVLSAFLWQAVSRARQPRLKAGTETTFARAIDPRRYLGLPATYPGLVQNMTYATYTLETLSNESLGSVSSKLRSLVDPRTSDIGYATRALVTWTDRAEDRSNIGVTATLDLSSDIMLSSWAKYECYELDFNLGLGKPEEVRRPQFTPVESLFYLMPKKPDGEIAAGLCLRDEDLERLREDEDFKAFAVYVG